MLRLNSQDSITVELPGGAKIHFDAPNPRIIAAGRRRVRDFLEMETEDGMAGDARDETTVLFTEGIALAAATGWEGIGDKDGNPLEFTRENLRLALADTLIFDRVDAQYVLPIMERELEKNDSAASPDGTLATATAVTNTANSAAATTPETSEPKPATSRPKAASSGASSKPKRKKPAPKTPKTK